MIARAHIVNKKLNFKLTQVRLDRAYQDHVCDTFKINAFMYLILLKIFMDMDAYVYVKQKKSTLVEQYTLMSINNILALTMWLGRPQTQKVSCKYLAMMASTSHSTRNSTL